MGNDHEILLRLRQGDQEAYKFIFKLYFKGVCYAIQTILKEYNEPPDDIAVETFVALWEKRTDFFSMENVKGYIYITASNKCRKFIRENQKKKKNLEELKRFTDYIDNPVEQNFEDQEVLASIEDTLDSMAPGKRIVFILHNIRGWKLKKIASVLKLHIGTVKTQNFRAIKNIQENIKRNGTY